MTSDDVTIAPFRIDIPQADIDDLHERLRNARWSAAEQKNGISSDRVRQLAELWHTGFDWRKAEAALNQHEQLTTVIDGQMVHAVHSRSADPNAVPLLMLHGWPSSIAEFHKLLVPLANPESHGHPAFHVVLASPPGFGFSSPLIGDGWGAGRMSATMAELMHRLGYSDYLAHGSDVGLEVVTALDAIDSEHLRGLHLNLGGVRMTGAHRAAEAQSEYEQRAFDRYDDYIAGKSAYATVQSTRPATLSHALTDSAVGQLAWIAEKFDEWTDPQNSVTDEDILTAASIYWFTRTAGSSARFYEESYGNFGLKRPFVGSPTAIAAFPYEIVPPVREWAETAYNVVQWTTMPAGGHFAALETPELVVDSLRRFSSTLHSGTTAPQGEWKQL
jgi:microsomal epoxide hydrolase